MPFATVAVPFDAYRQLPTPQHRWLLMCLARYADREGVCWPSIRQLAADSRMSKSSVQRYLADLSQLGIFTRERKAGGRYRYTLGQPYCPGKMPAKRAVPDTVVAVPHHGRQEAQPIKHKESPAAWSPWEPRLRGWEKRRFWLPQWGPTPAEAGCFIPEALRTAA